MSKSTFYFSVSFLFVVLCFFSCAVMKGGKTANNWIRPGEIWPDNNGNHIQAHGGGIIKVGKTYYWYGEYRGKDATPPYKYVGCYSSKDLMNWTFLNKIKFAAPEGFNPEHWVLERPKVYYNRNSKKYVMYFHLDDGRYRAAEVGVAVSDEPD